MQTRASAARAADAAIAPLAAILLIVAALVAFVPGQASVPPIDRDEPRFTQATKQMLETGDFVEIRFQEAPRNKKPIGIHWLQAAAATLHGGGAEAPLWVYRLPSVLGAMAAVLLAVWAARAFLPLSGALIVGALLGSTVILGVEARLAKTDAMLLATILAMQGALARVWLDPARRWGPPVIFWAAMAAGILVKGPIAPMVGLTTAAVLAVVSGRSLIGRMRPLVGLLIVAAVCLPWFVAIWQATDGAFFRTAIGNEFLGKAAEGQEGHWGPPLYHAALFFVVAWPLSAIALAGAWRIWRARGPAFLFAAAWVIPSWLVFELTPTKLPHYTLPLVTGIAIAAVAALALAEPPRALRIAAAVLLVALPLGLAAAIPFGFAAFETPVPLVAVALAAVAAAIALFGGIGLARGAPVLSARVIAPAALAAAVAHTAVWGVALPALTPVWVSPRLVAAADAAAPCADPRLISIGGYNEPSMIFLAGTDTGLLSPAEAVAAAREGCVVIAVRENALPLFEAEALGSGLAFESPAIVEGFNISKGDPVRLYLFVRSDA